MRRCSFPPSEGAAGSLRLTDLNEEEVPWHTIPRMLPLRLPRILGASFARAGLIRCAWRPAATEKIFAQAKFNRDGIIPVAAAEDAATQQLITDIIECLGAEQDRSGQPGVSQDTVDHFFTEAEAYSQWWAKAEGKQDTILP